MKSIILLLLCATIASAQFRQIAGSSGSVAGSANSANTASTALVGQPVVGSASGGAFGTRGGFTSIFEETIVALDVPDQIALLPTEYSFAQNFPNPFNPSTTFQFSLPQNGLATLTVYDQLGREAAEVFSRELIAGNYTTQFHVPASWASGVYFAVFRAGKYSQVRKMVLLK